MIQEFAEDLSSVTIYANGSELATIMGMDKDKDGNRVYTYPLEEKLEMGTLGSPVLVTDNHKISQIPDSTQRETVFALYSSPTRITKYKDTEIIFTQNDYPGVWGPSIDTILFCAGLGNQDLSGIKSAVEVGCGSGFISKHLLNEASDLERMTLIDLNEHAIKCATDNIDDPRAEFHTGDATEILDKANNEYDLIICNPPYIPRPKSIDDNPYEGIGLSMYLLDNLDKIGTDDRKFITMVSSLSVDKMLGKIQEKQFSRGVLAAHYVPLKVFNVLNNEEWLDYLLDNDYLEKNPHAGYDHWQKIEVTKIY